MDTKIEYKTEDDELNAEKSVNAYNTLKDWGMQLLVGSNHICLLNRSFREHQERQYVPAYTFRIC
nr:hypothetical protein [Butyrivibrio sp. FCS014]